jgi:hypothetical protein
MGFGSRIWNSERWHVLRRSPHLLVCTTPTSEFVTNRRSSRSVFKYLIKGRGEKMEQTSISYATLARVIQDGGLKIAIIARYSLIPGHGTVLVLSWFSVIGTVIS